METETSIEAYTPKQQMTTPVQRKDFFSLAPKSQVAQAAEIADVLSAVIEKQGLYSNIQGKKYIKAEGWQTLGTFLGVITREKYVKRLEDGSYESYIEIVKFNDGTVVGGASALCSRKENRWKNADEYAVRSMSVTRAVGKAFRISFAWIVTLAGYSATNEEEMPEYVQGETKNVTPEKSKSRTRTIYSSPEPAPEAPAPSVVVEAEKPKQNGYDPHQKNHQDFLLKVLQSKNVPDDLWDEIGFAMTGKTFADVSGVISAVMDKYGR